ncbi:MAG: hypothetical protein AAF619_06175 [Pseudomonadota bacterium]
MSDFSERPFIEAKAKARAVIRVYLQYVGFVVLISLPFGPVAPLAGLALLMTFGLPILLLFLWGQALDQRLGWMDRLDDW